MMEQLAERRMAREEEANNANGTIQRDSNMHHHPHNHVAPTDYDEDEEDDDEYEDDEDYDDEDDEEEEPVCVYFEVRNPGADSFTGHYDGRATYGRRAQNVPNLRRSNV